MTTQTASTSRWVKCISLEGNIRGVALQAADLVQSIADRHRIQGDAIQGLGESVMGALLISSHCKAGQRINLNIRGSGLYQQALVDAYPDGSVRGYVVQRAPERVLLEGQSGPWGTGLLSVLRTKDEPGQMPYIGTVPLLTGHLAKDLSFYWVQSEQIPSAVGLAVHLNHGRVETAGGFLVQALPGASSSEIRAIEQHIHEIQAFADQMGKDSDPLKLLSQIFQSTAFMVIEERPLHFNCNCSWERVYRALSLIGVQELRAMRIEESSSLVRCDFCAKEYPVDHATLDRLIGELEEVRFPTL